MRKRVFLGFYDSANFVTLGGLLFSLAGCFLAVWGNIRFAVLCLIIAGIADLFDGFIAGRLERKEIEKAFGVQLDSLVDVLSFGITPVLISFCNGATEIYALIVYALYLVAAVIRLAYFNTAAAPENKGFSQGLPVTYAALILPIAFLIPVTVLHVVMFAVLAVAYMVNVRIPKPRGVWYVVFPLLAVGLIIAWCLL